MESFNKNVSGGLRTFTAKDVGQYFPEGFACMIAASPRSGKSHLTEFLLGMKAFQRRFARILIVSNTSNVGILRRAFPMVDQKFHYSLEEHCLEDIIERVKATQIAANSTHHAGEVLIVFDDCFGSRFGKGAYSRELSNLAALRRHYRVSTISICQACTGLALEQRKMLDTVITFRPLRAEDAKQISRDFLAPAMGEADLSQQILKSAFQIPYQALIISRDPRINSLMKRCCVIRAPKKVRNYKVLLKKPKRRD